MKAIPFRLILPAAIIETLLIGLRFLANPANEVVEAITLLLLTSTVYILAVYFTVSGERTEQPHETSAASRKQLFIIATAILFRVTVFPIFPSLSDDLYRYRWEGKLQGHGGNPYQVRPIDAQWSHVRDTTFPNVGSKDFKGIYGPLILLEERAVYKAVSNLRDEYSQVFWFKLPAALADLGLIAAVSALLKVHHVPPGRLLIYAWSPTPLVEFWISGHNDAIVLLFIVLAFVAAASNRWAAGFLALSIAIASKVWPAVLLPAFLWRSRKAGPYTWAWSLLLIPVGLLPAIPYWSHVVENAQFASGFVGGWRNNDSLFGALLWLAGGDLYRAKYTAFALIAVVATAAAVSRWSLERAALVTILFTLFVSANCHPWYLTWFVPLLTLFPFPPILLWTALMPLSYQVLIGWKILGIWNGSTTMRWFIYLPVFGTIVLYMLREVIAFVRNEKQSTLVLR